MEIKHSVGKYKFSPTGVNISAVEKAFIKLYKQLTHLWNPHHPDYNNRCKRNAGYDELLKIYRRLMPKANRAHVRQKINILRSCYRKELRRHLASRTVTAEGKVENTYMPTSWKFHALKFLNLDEEANNEGTEAEIQSSPESYEEEQELEYIQDVDHEESMHEDEVYTSKIDASPLYIDIDKSPKNWNNQSLSSGNNILEKELNAIGANVSCKLLRMNDTQRYRAELLINKVLINGLKDLLTDETDLTDVWRVEETLHKDTDKECDKLENDDKSVILT